MQTKKVLFFVLAILLSGCVPVMTLNPIYTESDIKYDEKILGTWEHDSNEPEHTWIFEKNEKPQNSYKLTFIDADDDRGQFRVFLVRLGDDLYFDVSPQNLPNESSDPNEKIKWTFNEGFFQPLHTFIKVDLAQEKREMSLRLAIEDNIEKLLEEDPQAIEHQRVNGRMLITASTEKLQQFIKKYTDHKKLFVEPIPLIKSDPARQTSKNQKPQEK